MSKRPIKIVIVGGGFGGVYVAKNLAAKLKCCAEIVLIDKRNYFLFTPLLHEVATATISEKVPVESLVTLLNERNIRWKVGEVTCIDLNMKTVMTDVFKESYDYLVLATGSGQNTFGIEGVSDFALPMKDLKQAVKIKEKLVENFQLANITEDLSLKKKLLSITVVGAGATGIELAGELADFAVEVAGKYFSSIKRSDISLILVNPTEKFLPRNNPKLSVWVKEYLNKLGWELKIGAINKLSKDKLHFETGDIVETGLIIWTAGVKPNLPKFEKAVGLDSTNRVLVDDSLLVTGYDNVFALGDVANTKNGLPMLAQVAVQQAEIVASNIVKLASGKKKLDKFNFEDKGFLLSVGKWNAVGEIYGYPIKGSVVWILWHLVYFFKFISWNKKVKVAFDWLLNLFSYRDLSKG